MSNQQVILVNEKDEPVGSMEKMEAHKKGLLHRAFSIFIFNSQGEMLLQQRAFSKYHSGGLWSNACCSHPALNDELIAAAKKRLNEELGIESELEKAFAFMYKAEFENGLTEYEFDHVLVGVTDGKIIPNPGEVNDYCFRSFEAIEEDLAKDPAAYTEWFKIAFPKIKTWWQEASASPRLRGKKVY